MKRCKPRRNNPAAASNTIANATSPTISTWRNRCCDRPAVEPRELPSAHLLAGLDGGANALILETDLLDRIAICQMSGSLTQTAYGLLSDIVAIAREGTPVRRA